MSDEEITFAAMRRGYDGGLYSCFECHKLRTDDMLYRRNDVP